jgi:hypothetical protein
MATTILDKEITSDASTVVNQAVRAATEASRRTVQSTQDAERRSRGLLEASTAASRTLFAAYTTAITAGIKATFDLQHAYLVAGTALLAAVNTSSRELEQQMTAATHQAQHATRDAWQAGVSAVEKLTSTTKQA